MYAPTETAFLKRIQALPFDTVTLYTNVSDAADVNQAIAQIIVTPGQLAKITTTAQIVSQLNLEQADLALSWAHNSDDFVLQRHRICLFPDQNFDRGEQHTKLCFAGQSEDDPLTITSETFTLEALVQACEQAHTHEHKMALLASDVDPQTYNQTLREFEQRFQHGCYHRNVYALRTKGVTLYETRLNHSDAQLLAQLYQEQTGRDVDVVDIDEDDLLAPSAPRPKPSM